MKKFHLYIFIILGVLIIIWIFWLAGQPRVQAEIKITLTAAQKTELSALIEIEKEKTNSLNYGEALEYIKSLNRYTVKRKFANIDLKDIYPQLKAELETNIK